MWNELVQTFSNSGTRNDVRLRVVNQFAKEPPALVMVKAHQNIYILLKL